MDFGMQAHHLTTLPVNPNRHLRMYVLPIEQNLKLIDVG
jgi:hypothetical protein